MRTRSAHPRDCRPGCSSAALPRAGYAFAHVRRLAMERLEDRRVLSAGPSVIGQFPEELQSDATPLSAITLTFDKAIDPTSFSEADVLLEDPQGLPIAPVTVTALAGTGDTQFTLSFADQNVRGKHRLTVGPEITDTAGNLMNQDGDGTNGEAEDAYSGRVLFAPTVWSPPAGEEVLYYEDFENWSTVPDYWLFVSGLDGTVAASTNDPHAGTHHLRLDAPTAAWPPTNQYATVQVDLSSEVGETELWLDFRTKRVGDWDYGLFYVEIAGDGHYWNKVDWHEMLRTHPPKNYLQYVFDLDQALAVAGIDLAEDGDVYVRFRDYINGGRDPYDVYLDDVRISRGDVHGPKVIDQSPAELGADGGPLAAIRLTFDEAIDPTSFSEADVLLKDPQGVEITGVTVVHVAGSGETQFDLVFADQDLRGRYRLTVGPNISDAAGNPMNQNGDNINGEGSDVYEGTVQFAPNVLEVPGSPGTELYDLYVEDFEGWPSVPPYWSFTSEDTGYVRMLTWDGHSGANHLRFWLPEKSWPETPWISQSATFVLDLSEHAAPHEIYLNFWARTSVGNSELLVELSGDGETWPRAASVSGLTGRYDRYAVDIDELVGDGEVVLDNDVYVRLRFRRSGYGSAGGLWMDDLRLYVDDTARGMSLDIPLDTVGEEVGDLAAAATVTRTGNTSFPLEVILTNSEPSELSVPATVTIPKFGDSAEFNVYVINDPELDGTQAVTITASVADGSVAEDSHQVEVTDDDQPGALTIGGRLQGTLGSGVYTVLTGLDVIPGATLAIEPESALRFAPGKGISVGGTLLADAEPDSEIVFTSSSDVPAPGDWAGIEVTNSAGPRTILDHVKIGFASTGLSVTASDPRVTLSNGEVHDSRSYGVLIEAGRGEFIDGDDALVSGNRIHGSGDAGIRVYARTGADDYTRCTPMISGNEVFDQSGPGIAIGATYTGGVGIATSASSSPSLSANSIHHNETGIAANVSAGGTFGSAHLGGTWTNNLVAHNRGHGIQLGRSGSRAFLSPGVINNTIAYNGAAGIQHATLWEYASIRNNVVVNNARGVEATSAFSPEAGQVGFNDVWHNGDTEWVHYPVEFGDPTTTNANGTPADEEMNINVDPQFVDSHGFHLRSSSPAVNAGTDDGAPAYDFEGDPRIAPSDIGFDEYPVVGRLVFYNNSAFDDPARGLSDDDAVAPAPDAASEPRLGKTALLPAGTAGFQNYTSYEKGINGLAIDIAGLPASALYATNSPDTSDFEFRLGNDDHPESWRSSFDTVDPVPLPSSVTVAEDIDGQESDRVKLIWDDYAIVGQWLQVRVLATERTGLEHDDVFYFGNAPGEAGDSDGHAIVNTTDEILIRDNLHSPRNPAELNDAYDYNRDRLVNVTDRIIARDNRTGVGTALRLINPPEEEAGAGGGRLSPAIGHDVVLEWAARQQSTRETASLGKLAWLADSDCEQLFGRRRSANKERPAARAIDRLLASCRP